MRSIVPGDLVIMRSEDLFNDCLWSQLVRGGRFLYLTGLMTPMDPSSLGIVVALEESCDGRHVANVLFPGRRASDYAYVSSLVPATL